jgi:hypothetical protein
MHNVTSMCAWNCATDSPQKVISFQPQGSHFLLAQFQHILRKVITTLCTCCHISLKNLLYVNNEFGWVNLSIKHNVKISACQNIL